MINLLEAPFAETCEKIDSLPVSPHAYRKTAPGSAAEDELVRENLPLVKTIVARIALTLPSHVDSEELHSAGLVGLLNAVRQFNPTAGSSFASYARVRIRGAIMDELRRLDWVPRSVHDKARKVQAAIQELEQRCGQLPDAAEVASELGITLPEYEQLMEDIKPVTFVSLDCAGEDDPDDTRYDSFADETQTDPSEAAASNELGRIILERLHELPEMQKKVLALYYFEDLRLREIAAVFGVTESRICQVHAQAVLAIRTAIRKQEQLAAACL